MTVCHVCGRDCGSVCAATAAELREQLLTVRHNARIVAAERDAADEEFCQWLTMAADCIENLLSPLGSAPVVRSLAASTAKSIRDEVKERE